MTPDNTPPGVGHDNADLVPPYVTPSGTLKPVTPLPPSPGLAWDTAGYRVLKGAGTFGRVLWKFVKLGICMILDGLDALMVGWIGVSAIWEVIATLITLALWGHKAWWAALEIVEPTEILDPWVPSCTLIALASWNHR